MNYYRVLYSEDDNIDRVIIINDYNLKGFDYRRLWKVESIENWEKNIELYYEEEGELLDYTPNVLSWLIVSEEVIHVFNELNTRKIQVFPVKLINKLTGDKSKRANVINIIDEASILNWKKSEVVRWADNPKDIKFIKRLVIDSSKIKNLPSIFKLSEKSNYIICSQEFKNKIEERKLKGFDFLKIDIEP